MATERSLQRARSLLRQRSFREAIEVLEGTVDSPEASLTAGKCRLFLQDFPGARRDLENVIRLDPANCEARNGLAYVAVLTGEREKAINLWYDVLQIEPSDRTARTFLEKLRRNPDWEALEQTAGPADFVRIPSQRPWDRLRELPRAATLATAIGLLAIFTAFATLLVQRGWTRAAATRANERERRRLIEEIILEPQDIAAVTTAPGPKLRTLTPEEVRRAFNECRRLVANNESNRAIIAINQLLHSNVSPAVRSKLNLLRKLIRRPDNVTVSGSPTYAQVMRNPKLYRGVYVKWKGGVANFTQDSSSTVFDLLVDYQDKRTLTGIATVHFKSGDVPQKERVEVFGLFVNVDRENRRPLIQGYELW